MSEEPSLPRLLVIMGSGETSPTMVTTHRRLIERLGPAPAPAVVLDTPFGFQANVEVLTQRVREYFRESVGVEVTVAGWRRSDAVPPVEAARSLARLREARYVFAGPGSPSYALRQWAGSPVPAALSDKLAHGGCITFASAAALTLGAFTVPVYEIYKVGEDPRWLDGLDLLAGAGLPEVAVIPHYDNAEGGNHDTRYCYLGEPRLAYLEGLLPESAFVLGVDEHTGLVLDLDAATATVVGRGSVTVRRRGHSLAVPAGTTVAFAALRRAAMAGGLAETAFSTTSSTGGTSVAGTAAGEGSTPPSTTVAGEATSVLAAARLLEGRFVEAVAGGDADEAVAAVLDLDVAIVSWSRDTLQSDEADQARATLRSMVVRLGDLVRVGAGDPADLLRPLVDALLEVRTAARAERDWAAADALRDRLAAAGVEIKDTPEGTSWTVLS